MKILLCIDDDSQYEAILAAPDNFLARAGDDEVLVAHVVATLRWLPLKDDATGWAGTEREILQRVDDFLERTVGSLEQRGIKAKALRLEGDTALELLSAARDHDIDVIITGAIGQARGQDFLVGSVAEKLESLTHRDLLMVRAEKDSPGTPIENTRVTIAIDDTDASFSAIERFLECFRVERTAVEIVHVMQVPPPRLDAAPEPPLDESGSTSPTSSSIPPVVRERADRAVSRAQELFSSRGVHPRLALRRGDPAREVLEAARAFDANLVVVGRGEQLPGTRFVGWRGTVTKRVAQHAPCSVFIAGTGPPQPDDNTRGEHESQSSRADGG